MQCRNVREKLVTYLDGDARPTERLGVEAHIGWCYRCREELEETRELLETSREALRHPGPRYDFARLKARMARIDARAATRMPRLTVRALIPKLAMAAALLLLVGASSPLVFQMGHWLVPLDDATNPALERTSVPVVSQSFVGRKSAIDESLGASDSSHNPDGTDTGSAP
jgi:anti-sigma factor RsiW